MDTLVFQHEIPLTISTTNQQSRVTVKVNGVEKFNKKFDPGTNDVKATFEHSYVEGAKNNVSFEWEGFGQEDRDKGMKINQIIINGQALNVHNAEYFPTLNPVWYSNLNDDEKKMYNERIYGKAGKIFGWFGRVNFYYCTGFDYRSRNIYNVQNKSVSKILAEKVDWVYYDRDFAKLYHRVKND